MAAMLSPSPKLRFYGRDGKPLSGGYLFTYDYVTSTPVSTFADADMSTRNPVQIQLDANGEPSNNGQPVSIFLIKDKRYKFAWYDSEGNFIDKVEPVQCPGGDSEGGGGGSIYEIAMFDLSQVGNGLYDDIAANLSAGLLPIIYTGSQGSVRYYYYTARDQQAHTMTFTCGYNGDVQLLTLHSDGTYEIVRIPQAALPIRIVDNVITNNGTDLNVFGDNSWSEGIGKDEYEAAEAVGNLFLDSVIELDYVGSLRAGDIVLIGDSLQAVSEVRYGSNVIVVAPGVHVSGGEKVYRCGGSLGVASHTEGRATETVGKYSHAEGYRSKASGYYSHAEGKDTRAYSDGAHAEGTSVVAQGPSSHAEGYGSTDYMEVVQDCTESSDVEVSYIGSDVIIGARANIGNDIYSIVAIDEDTPSITLSSTVTLHAGDRIYVMTGAFGAYSHAEGDATVSAGTGSHSEGSNTAALEVGAHAEGRETVASNYSAHAEGDSCVASGINAHAEGNGSVASSYCSHAEGSSESNGYYSHSEGDGSVASSHGAHAEGNGTFAAGYGAHAEGQDCISLYYGSHAEGYGTFASGYGAHSEGYGDVMDTYNVVDDDGGYERSSVRLDGIYGIHVGDLVCFDYQWPSSSNDWFLVTYVDTDTNTIDIDGYTSALNGDSVYIALGTATGDGAHVEGKYCTASGVGAHAGGEVSSAYGLCAFSQGEGNDVFGDYSTAIGKYNNVDSDESVAIGSSCYAYADNTVTIGTYVRSSSNARYATTIGFGANANAYASTAIGVNADANGSMSLAINRGKSFGAYSVCIGDSGYYSFSTYTTADVVESDTIPVDDISGIFVGDIVEIYGVGVYTVTYIGVDYITINSYVNAYEYTDIYVWRKGALGDNSLHIGTENAAKGDHSVCIGEGLTMAANHGVSLGKYNSDSQAKLVVGDGADENTPSDCFKIDGQSKLWFMHNGNLTDLSTLLNTHNIT